MNGHGGQPTALILARGGSKSIPLKNIRPLNGIPLIGWCLRAAKDWGRFGEVWVSTDHPEIEKVARQLGALVHRRPPEVSLDETPSLEAAQEFLSHPQHQHIRVLALIQCTSPCLHPRFLEDAYNCMTEHRYDSVFSVNRQFKLRWKEVDITSGECTEPLNLPADGGRPRRQDWSGELVESGMFYFVDADIVRGGSLQSGKCGYMEIPEECVVDIDSPVDWIVAEAVVAKYGYMGGNQQH